MIIDRTQADIARVSILRSRIKNRTATPEEWIEWLSGLRGAYNHTDLNRVGIKAIDLADTLSNYGYSITVTPRTDWTMDDIPTATELDDYLVAVKTLKDKLFGTTELPVSIANDMTFTDANNIEKLLLEIEGHIELLILGFRVCGTFNCGQGVILP